MDAYGIVADGYGILLEGASLRLMSEVLWSARMIGPRVNIYAQARLVRLSGEPGRWMQMPLTTDEEQAIHRKESDDR